MATVQLMPKKEAAANLGISRPMLDRLIYRGAISCVRVGSRVLFQAKDIAEFIEKCSVPRRDTQAV